MKLHGLNSRQCRAVVKLLDGPLSERGLATAIGGYSTNTIKALETARLIVGAVPDEGDELVYELTQPGRAIADAVRQLGTRHVRVDVAAAVRA